MHMRKNSLRAPEQTVSFELAITVREQVTRRNTDGSLKTSTPRPASPWVNVMWEILGKEMKNKIEMMLLSESIVRLHDE